ncbi:hypothetical protein [Isachenkonia alkalipeptolytica]|uniref:hypothetical protein n=1 Tax=Isachenkonia alkalipeptolytica TaxID=2565777 RepID=UPI00136DD287|nr:hypothetical protein [Isachenkonia alkalipeptolytica]
MVMDFRKHAPNTAASGQKRGRIARLFSRRKKKSKSSQEDKLKAIRSFEKDLERAKVF